METTAEASTAPLHTHTQRLSYGDTDPAQILYFASWFPKMESLLSEFLYLNGYRQDECLARFGWTTVTRATDCEYLAPARLFDEIRIELRVAAIGTTSVRFGFRMQRLNDDVTVARGSIVVVIVDARQAAIPVPPAFRSRLETWAT